MGITTKEWVKLPEAKKKQPLQQQQQQQQQVAASAEVKEKLAAELTGLQAGSPPEDDKGAGAQARERVLCVQPSAATQHLELMRLDTRQQGHAALDADAKRRPPPPNNLVNFKLTKRAPAPPPAPAAGASMPGGHARNIAHSLCKYVEVGAAHVLRCVANPTAKPVYYIFMEDQRCPTWHAEFTSAYLAHDDRKFTRLQWGAREFAAPWLMPVLGALEALCLPPPPPPLPARQAYVAERPEHDSSQSYHTMSSFSARFGVQRGDASVRAIYWRTT
ncbi:hypothetical protein CYMTET_39812 [Cymbomonas tetramitiformis]|uniref:Uncharacterized protein n=1 Tax=Cymbomonas tetramitiformis TaxID=36881 RepID=A0AAE0C9C9_9CHLO|nr:hypothetical protein CYMTET_39812 [Cymbomonas tetramitiformis]